MAWASAPGKVILLGEHAVVFGEPAIAVALDLRTKIRIDGRGTSIMVNGEPLQEKLHLPHVHQALALTGEPWGPLDIRIESAVPRASGLGSSAALSAALIAALQEARGLKPQPRDVARLAFEVELAVQEGRASPTDTSTSVAGGAVLVDSVKGPGLLWDLERGGKHWFLHRLNLAKPPALVVGHSGERAPTGQMVAMVHERVRRDPRDLQRIRSLGALAREGAKALSASDFRGLGQLMDRAHADLRALGVSTPRLDELVHAARKRSFGAKLTGAGGGGSIIALTEHPNDVAAALRTAGCDPIVASVTPRGLEAGA